MTTTPALIKRRNSVAASLMFLSGLFQLSCPSVMGQSLTSYPTQVIAPINPAQSVFNGDSGVTFGANSSTCPITTLNISGYAADGDNWALFNNNNSSGRTGAGNYGVIAGISMPFPGGLAAKCKENMEAYIRSIRLTASATLVRSCAEFIAANVDFTDKEFQKNFPEMGICRFVKGKSTVATSTQPAEGSESGSVTPPPLQGVINTEKLPKGSFNFGPPQAPLLQTLPLR
jgi:hypothetical protein